MVNDIIIVTQARIGSSRFPEKVLKPLGYSTLLGIHLERLKKSKRKTKIIVATTFEEKSNEIINIANKLDIDVFQGSTDDVLDRFYKAVKQYNPKLVVRVTSDCPLIDPLLIDSVIEMVENNNLDYGSNVLIEAFPDGQDVEVFTFKALEIAWKDAKLSSEREHVTPYIRNNSDFKGNGKFKALNFNSDINYNHVRMTVDEPSDLDTIVLITNELGFDQDWLTYTNYILNQNHLLNNQSIQRNEGYLKSLKNDK